MRPCVDFRKTFAAVAMTMASVVMTVGGFCIYGDDHGAGMVMTMRVALQLLWYRLRCSWGGFATDVSCVALQGGRITLGVALLCN